MLNDKYKNILDTITDYDEIKTVDSKLLADKEFIIALFYKFGKREDFFPDMILDRATDEITKDTEFLSNSFIEFLRLTYSNKYLYSNHEEALYNFFSNYIEPLLIDENITIKLMKDYSGVGILYDKDFLKDVENNQEYDEDDSTDNENLRDFLFRVTIEGTNFNNHTSLIQISDFIGWETIKYLPEQFKSNEELLSHLLKKNIKAKDYISDEIIKNSPTIASIISQKDKTKQKRVSKKELIKTLLTNPEKFTEETAGKKISISIKGLKRLTDDIAIALSKHTGDVTFEDLIEISDSAAAYLINLKGKIYFEKLETLTDSTAEILSKHKKLLYFMNLRSLSDAAALSFIKNNTSIVLYDENIESLTINSAKLFVKVTPYTSASLFGNTINRLNFFSIKNITKEIAFELSNFKGKLSFPNLNDITVETAKELANHQGPELYFGGLRTINHDVAKMLSNYKGKKIYFSSLTTISDEAAAELSNFNGVLNLDNLLAISVITAKHLSNHKGKELYLNGLINLSVEVAIELSKHKGDLKLNGISELSEDEAIALSKHEGSLELNKIKTITEKAAEAFAKSKNSFEFYNLKDISESILAKLKKNDKISFSDFD